MCICVVIFADMDLSVGWVAYSYIFLLTSWIQGPEFSAAKIWQIPWHDITNSAESAEKNLENPRLSAAILQE